MNRIHTLLASALLLALASPSAFAQKAPVNKKLYCWNENGQRICGDALPASAVDNARTEISAKSGRATAQISRTLTAEERAAVEAAEAQARSQARALEAQKRRDNAMAETFATEDALRRSFNDRIQLLDSSVVASRAGAQGRRNALVSKLRRAAELELGNKPVNQVLATDIRTQHDELLRQQDILKKQIAERTAIDEELAAALRRFNNIKSPSLARGG